MKHLRHFIAVILLGLALPGFICPQVRAQFNGDNQTNLISGVTNIWSGGYYVGSNYVFDALLIQNSGVLSNDYGYVGFYANSNSATVSGSGSVWFNKNDSGNSGLRIGVSGTGNSLVISNGGVVFSWRGDVGSSGASNNSVLVTGSGSVWSNTDLTIVGEDGAANSLVISNGGAVFDRVGDMGSVTSPNNYVLVTGTGSIWRNRDDVFTGNDYTCIGVSGGDGSSLVISNGGAVLDGEGYVGGFGLNTVSNSVLVTGSGSIWNNLRNLIVGYSSGSANIGNALTVANGGSVVASNAVVGFYSGSLSNRIVVSGGSLYLTNAAGSRSLQVGASGAGNSLVISNGGKVFNDGGIGYLGNKSSASNNSVLVTGSGSVWNNSAVQVGAFFSDGNSLIISNGGVVASSSSCFIGTANNNSVLVTGSGSAWNAGSLDIGLNSGAGNVLTIADGGAVFDGTSTVGSASTSSNSFVLVTGAGSLWSTSNSFRLGFLGAANSLVVSNGGKVVSLGSDGGLGSATFIGLNGSASNNNVFVTGSGSVWSIISSLSVGYSSTGNTLTITNGGSVVASNAYVGYGSGAMGNRIIVSGGNLYATNTPGTGSLDVRRGTLTFDGGSIISDKLFLTNGSSSIVAFNGGVLTTKGTAVTNSQQFIVGNGAASATFHLLGGVHSFNNGLRIRTNSFLTGCGTVNGSVIVDPGGTVSTDCGLTFTGNVTNNGVMVAKNGGILDSSGTLVNNGTILLFNGGSTNFHGAFINNGSVVIAGLPLISNVSCTDSDVTLQIPSLIGLTYQMQFTPSLPSPVWSDSGTAQSGTGSVLTFTDFGGATNAALRFYRMSVQ